MQCLHPGEIGVTPRGGRPNCSARRHLAEPVGVIEGRIGKDEIGARSGWRSRRNVSACLASLIFFNGIPAVLLQGCRQIVLVQ